MEIRPGLWYSVNSTQDRQKEVFMGFWIFMLLMDLIIPLTMIGFGRYLMKNNPKEPNALFGYRTAMSLKNKDTWAFANTYCGKIWYVCGWILLPVTVICFWSLDKAYMLWERQEGLSAAYSSFLSSVLFFQQNLR